MKKLLAVITIFLIFLTSISTVSSINSSPGISSENELDIVKKQLLIESAKVTDIGMVAAKEMLIRAFSENRIYRSVRSDSSVRRAICLATW
jgi:hypothetical protein